MVRPSSQPIPADQPTTRGLTHRWITSPDPGPAATRPGIAAGLPPLIARILAARGLTDEHALRAFANPSLRHMHDPSAMAGIDDAAGQILNAAQNLRPIVIYGDYDVDGICATAILTHTLRALLPDAPLQTYVPHRLEEGYGLNATALLELASQGTHLVVSVDCGITAHEAARAAREAGLALIITDHHNFEHSPGNGQHAPQPHLPHALAIVHPRLPNTTGQHYPCPDLCGAAVAFKLAWRLATLHHGSDRVPQRIRDLLLDMLALAGLATIADIVPLLDENRVIARFGLERIKSTSITGLHALLAASDLLGERVGAVEAGFVLGPRLNACGRMGHARQAIELLTTTDHQRAADIAQQLNTLNAQRRETERRIFEQAASMAEDRGMTDQHHAIVLAHPDWHPGVVGIVCSRLVARYHRPAILLQHAEQLCKGSARSIDGFNLHHALQRCADALTTFGGHDMAAGLSLEHHQLEPFTDRFLAIAADEISANALTPSLRIDADATPAELTLDAARALQNLGPFGRANPDPIIVVRNTTILATPEPLGKDAKHLKLRAGDHRNHITIKAWNWAPHARHIHAGARADLAIRLEVNTFRGNSTAEATLCDLRIH